MPPRLEQWVNDQVRAGRYVDTDEVVRDALRRMKETDTPEVSPGLIRDALQIANQAQRDVLALVLHPQLAEPAAGADDDGRPGRLLLRRQEHGDVRVVDAGGAELPGVLAHPVADLLRPLLALEAGRPLLPERDGRRLLGRARRAERQGDEEGGEQEAAHERLPGWDGRPEPDCGADAPPRRRLELPCWP